MDNAKRQVKTLMAWVDAHRETEVKEAGLRLKDVKRKREAVLERHKMHLMEIDARIQLLEERYAEAQNDRDGWNEVHDRLSKAFEEEIDE